MKNRRLPAARSARKLSTSFSFYIAAYKGKHYTSEQPAIIEQPVW
jgi:hypothetical protein